MEDSSPEEEEPSTSKNSASIKLDVIGKQMSEEPAEEETTHSNVGTTSALVM
jgi:hypothetical protein